MLRMIASGLALSVALTGAAAAENFEVKMLNRGDAGRMIFEPGFLRIAVGDTVKFIAEDRSHNAESIPEMIPEGAAVFAGRRRARRLPPRLGIPNRTRASVRIPRRPSRHRHRRRWTACAGVAGPHDYRPGRPRRRGNRIPNRTERLQHLHSHSANHRGRSTLARIARSSRPNQELRAHAPCRRWRYGQDLDRLGSSLLMKTTRETCDPFTDSDVPGYFG